MNQMFKLKRISLAVKQGKQARIWDFTKVNELSPECKRYQLFNYAESNLPVIKMADLKDFPVKVDELKSMK